MISLRSSAVSLFLCLSFVFSIPAEAQNTEEVNIEEEYELYRLPEGRRCTVDGVTYQCFDLEEYKELLKMDADLLALTQQNEKLLYKISVLQKSIYDLELIIDEKDQQISLLQDERERLLAMWQEENKLRLEAENQPKLGNWVAWGIAAAEAGTILGLVLAMLL